MTKADGERLEQRLSVRIDKLDTKLDALSGRIDALGIKLVATAWTVGGVAVGILSAIKYLG